MLNGWKTKTGAVLAAAGGALVSMAEPMGWAWAPVVGGLLVSLGVALGGVGIAHKAEKLTAAASAGKE